MADAIMVHFETSSPTIRDAVLRLVHEHFRAQREQSSFQQEHGGQVVFEGLVHRLGETTSVPELVDKLNTLEGVRAFVVDREEESGGGDEELAAAE